ncbi:MAG TPA: DNA polymerase III subunit gamma/tau [Chitinophagales bacterium]|nr:DNA polymerase III subunit gamma/tau [Chitinophagales bacterium]
MLENFVVSARKYRPVRFEDVVGQENVTTTLQNAIRSGQLAHAYLFCGPRGVGKTTCARILAREVNGFEADESGDVSASLNIFELDAASNNSVEDIRTLVDSVRVPPQYGKYKVYIIDEVHMLSASAFNAFLKTLEEPPPYAIFILATTEKHKILPTIISRCQIFDFNRITVEDITKHLAGICKKEKINADEDALHIIAQKSDGALRDALSMLDRLVNYTDRKLTYESVLANLNVLDYDYYFKLTDHLLSQNHSAALLVFDEILRKGFDGGEFISGLGEHFRNLMVSKELETVSLLEVTASLKERYMQQAVLIPASYLLNAMNLANQCEVNYKTSNNKRLHVELTLMKLCCLNNILELPIEKFSAEGKKNKADEGGYQAAPVSKRLVEEPAVRKSNAGNQPAAPELVKREPTNITSHPSFQPPLTDSRQPAASGLTGTLRFSDLVAAEDDIKRLKKEKNPDSGMAVIDSGMLTEAWNEYVKILEKEKRLSLQSLMQQNKPNVEGGVVTVVLQSRLQKELFDNERTKLLKFLEEKLQVQGISLMAVVDKTGVPKQTKPFTASEKFSRMAEENPAILELQKRLDLKLEH